MSLFGYARVSSADQSLDLQIEALSQAGCEIIRAEKVSASSRQHRTELELLLQFIRAGDTLVITRIDRLARSVKDLQDIIETLKTKGATLKALDQPIDTGSAAGTFFLNMLGVFAEFETELRKERQRIGIDAAKKRGVYKGRKKTVDDDKIKELRAQGFTKSQIKRKLGVSLSSVYRALEKTESLPFETPQ